MTVGVVFISWKTCKKSRINATLHIFQGHPVGQIGVFGGSISWLMFDTPVPREQKSKSESIKFTEIETFQAVLQQ